MKNSLVVRRLIPVPRERVFAAWLGAASLAKWMRPRGKTDARVEVDPRVGGKFRIVMIHGREEFEHTGEYFAYSATGAAVQFPASHLVHIMPPQSLNRWCIECANPETRAAAGIDPDGGSSCGPAA